MSRFEARARLKVRDGQLEGFKRQAAERPAARIPPILQSPVGGRLEAGSSGRYPADGGKCMAVPGRIWRPTWPCSMIG